MERFDWRRTTNARLSGERIGALLIRLNAKARFVLVIEGKIVLLGRKADLEAQLVERGSKRVETTSSKCLSVH
jgi:hypothetical protein